MKSYIMLENVVIHANHGVFPQENKVGNIFKIDIKLEVDLEKSALTDNLEDTVSYADVYRIIESEMKIQSKLLEHVAGRIIKSLKREFQSIQHVEIKLSKQNPPMGGQVEYASIVLID